MRRVGGWGSGVRGRGLSAEKWAGNVQCGAWRPSGNVLSGGASGQL